MKLKELIERLKEDCKICGKPLLDFDVVFSEHEDEICYDDSVPIIDYDIDFGAGKLVLLTDDKERG